MHVHTSLVWLLACRYLAFLNALKYRLGRV